jgi:2-keto-4-pentenoate hydratase/2-oxohepta-3-ene-1,7-dioic acid hydratase in catechol pathway
VAVSLGPWVVTADEFDPSHARLVTRVGGDLSTEEVLATGRRSFQKLVSHASWKGDLAPGHVIRPEGRSRRRVRLNSPGAVVEVEAEGLGILRNRAGHPLGQGLPRVAKHPRGAVS